jgi:exodeoxyribonuclease-5
MLEFLSGQSLTKDQCYALEQLLSWIKKPLAQYITLGGYAGTGKTTLVSLFRKKLAKENSKLKVAFCSFTGKASQVLEMVLKNEGAVFNKDRVSTIHSLIYESVVDNKGGVLSWRKKDEIDYDLIIVDEASMVSSNIWEDLLSFGKMIIAVGDHGQLPPIGSSFSLMSKPDIALSAIHRQASQSPIIYLSRLAREEGKIPAGKYSKEVCKYGRDSYDIHDVIQGLIESWNDESLFLVGLNSTRIKLNEEIRRIQGRETFDPAVGDRVICLKNNWRVGIYNGMLGVITDIGKDSLNKKHWYEVEIYLDDGNVYRDKICKYQFNSEKTVTEVKGLPYSKIGDLFDYGYALTVHKAQGSQAKKVIVFEERNKYMTEEDWRRWLYTAVTRAEKELVVIGD